MVCLFLLLFISTALESPRLLWHMAENSVVWGKPWFCTEPITLGTCESHVLIKICLHLWRDGNLGGTGKKLWSGNHERTFPYGTLQRWTTEQLCLQRCYIKYVTSLQFIMIYKSYIYIALYCNGRCGENLGIKCIMWLPIRIRKVEPYQHNWY